MRARYLMVALGLAACSTEDQGNGMMTATINGVAWRASKVTGTRTETTISVGGQSTPFPVLTIDGTGVVGPGTYRVTDDIFAAAKAGFSVLDRNGFALTAGGGTGTLVITSWSDAQAAGTFSFTAGQGSGLHRVGGAFSVTF
jgi:uncharacterized protein DUF6252